MVKVAFLGHSYESGVGWTFNIQSHKLTALKVRSKTWIRPRRAKGWRKPSEAALIHLNSLYICTALAPFAVQYIH